MFKATQKSIALATMEESMIRLQRSVAVERDGRVVAEQRAEQERLARDIASLFQDAAVRQALLNGGLEPQGTGAATLAARVRSETQTFGNIIRERGIKLE